MAHGLLNPKVVINEHIKVIIATDDYSSGIAEPAEDLGTDVCLTIPAERDEVEKTILSLAEA